MASQHLGGEACGEKWEGEDGSRSHHCRCSCCSDCCSFRVRLNQLDIDLCESILIGSDIAIGLEPDLGRVGCVEHVLGARDIVEVLI